MSDFFTSYEGSEPYVFASYAHRDTDIVLPVIRGLHNRGVRVWYDGGLEVGTEWPETIAQHLLKSHCVIAFVSKNFGDSHNCRREIDFAIARHKDPVVIYLEDPEKLPAGMQLQLGSLHALFYDRYANADALVDAIVNAEILKPCFGVAASETAEEEQWDQFSTIEFADETDVTQSVLIPVTADERQGETMPATEGESDTSEVLYQRGLRCDVRCDFREAVKWYRMAAQQGHIKAQYNLGRCLFWGIGGEKCIPEGIEWIMKAAYKNEPTACYFLGNWYEEGKGVAKDVVRALSWYRSAKQNGYTRGIDADIARCEKALKKPWWKK